MLLKHRSPVTERMAMTAERGLLMQIAVSVLSTYDKLSLQYRNIVILLPTKSTAK